MFSREEASHWATVFAIAALVVGALACATAKGPQAVVKSKQASLVPAPKPQSALLNQLQGQWVGHPEANESERWEWTIKRDIVDAKTSDGDFYKGTIRLDDQARPIRMDVKLTDSSDPNLKGQTARGIVRFEGNKVMMCFNRTEGDYPSAFDSSQGLVLTGEKK